ncbi:hypothetical protein QBC45DRAFT_363325 [Copromyces sp. CBS 386.78]|nr:hypothetical protein QBC45DRAFT_363325 [Copromyces sp. CBS 386.78]
MDKSDDELGATEIGSSTGPSRRTKRQHDDSDEDAATDSSQIYKRQRVHDKIVMDGNRELENPDDQATSVAAGLDTTEPNTHHRALCSDEREILLALGFQLDDDPGPEEHVPNGGSHDGEANPAILPPDPATDYTNQAEPNHIGEWGEQDWMISNPAWDYTQDPLFEPQPYEPAPWFLDENLTIPPESGAPSAGLQAKYTGGVEVYNQHLFSTYTTSGAKVEDGGQTEHTNGVEVFDERLFSPDTTFSPLFTGGRHSLGSQTTEPTFLSSPVCAAPGIQGVQSPSPEQIFGQTSYSSAVFEPDLWQLTAAPNHVGTGELHHDGPASDYPFDHLELPASQDGDEIQVKE